MSCIFPAHIKTKINPSYPTDMSFLSKSLNCLQAFALDLLTLAGDNFSYLITSAFSSPEQFILSALYTHQKLTNYFYLYLTTAAYISQNLTFKVIQSLITFNYNEVNTINI